MTNREYNYTEQLDLIRVSLGALVGASLRDSNYRRANELVAFAQTGYWSSLSKALENGILTQDSFRDARQKALSGPFKELRALISTAQRFEEISKRDASSAETEARKY